MNYKTLSIVFAILAVIFIASTGYLAAAPGMLAHTSTIVTTVTRTGGGTTAASSTSNSASQQAAFTINIGYKSSLGFYLVNGSGFSLYVFTNDTQGSGVSTCYGGCATFWPAVSVASIAIPPGLNSSSFGIITRTGGEKQATYDGWPLYNYAGDSGAGQTKGEGVDGTWFVASVPVLNIPTKSTTSSTSTSSIVSNSQ
jgi:predicted lipoprotein with Yx(FWY)xxD motif